MISINKYNILDVLITILHTIDKKNKLSSIYVSIGSATNILQDQKSEIYKIDPKLEQQYPPFLKNLKEELPFEPLHIFLIDPVLELPPYMVSNLKNNELDNGWIETLTFKKFGIKSYYNKLSNIYVYAINNSVKYSPLSVNGFEKYTNIDKFFKELNNLSIMNKWFTVVNDFTGKNMKDVANYYDKVLHDHIDHIIYGIGIRKDGGCYLDVTKPECNFVYTISSNDGIKIYNPFKKSNKNDIELIKSLNELASLPDCSEKNKKKYEIVKAQLWQYIKFKRKFIMIDLMTFIRQIGMLEQNKITDIFCLNFDNFYMENNYNVRLTKMIKNKQYYKALDALIKILKIELNNHLYVVYKKNTNLVVNHTISQMLLCDNPYKWYNFIKKVIDDFDERTGTNIDLMGYDD